MVQHEITKFNKIGGFSWYFLFKPSLLILSIMSVRFNIINSIHNFINLESQNQYFYYIIYIISLCLFLGFYKMVISINIYKKITINNLFTYFLLIFYLFFIINLGFINSVFVNLLTLFKIKLFYIFIILMGFIFVLLAKKKVYRVSIFAFIVLFYIKVNIINTIVYHQIIDFVILFTVLFCFKKSKSTNRTKKENDVALLHNNLILFFCVSLHQIYNFVPLYKSIFSFDLYCKIINNFIVSDLGILYLKIFITSSTDIAAGLFSGGVFEKKLSYTNNYSLLEQYNYNNQILIQLYGGLLFGLLSLLIFILYFLNKRKNFKNINL